MTLSVVIPTFGRVAPLGRLLESIRQQRVPPDEVIVVDQNAPGVLDACLAASGVTALRVLRLDEANAALARNTGFAASSSTHVLFIDDDEVMPPDFIERVVDVFARNPHVRCLWPSVGDHDKHARAATELVRVPRAGSGGVTFEREYFRTSGGYDPTLFRFGRMAEDWELGHRMQRRGLEVWHAPSIFLRHDSAAEGGCAIRSSPYDEARIRAARAVTLMRRILRGAPFSLGPRDAWPIVRLALLSTLGRPDARLAVLRRPLWHLRITLRAMRESREYVRAHAERYADVRGIDHLTSSEMKGER